MLREKILFTFPSNLPSITSLASTSILAPPSPFASNPDTLPYFTQSCGPPITSPTLKQGLSAHEVPALKFPVRDRPFNVPPSRQTGFRKRVWKPNKRDRRMTLGDDVGLENTCRLAMCGLVGRLTYSYLNDIYVSDWVTKNWTTMV
jgi:hypothetical protein